MRNEERMKKGRKKEKYKTIWEMKINERTRKRIKEGISEERKKGVRNKSNDEYNKRGEKKIFKTKGGKK